MADHNKPTSASLYSDYTSEINARFNDLAIGLDPEFVTATNVPTNAMRFSSAAAKWQRWNGSSWVDPVAAYAINITGTAGAVTNGVYTNGTYSNPSWLISLAGSKITGDIAGNAATATTLQTARTINGVSFNGSTNIAVNTVASVTFNNAGAGAASGATFNGGSAITVSYNTVGAPSATGAGASGTWGINVSGNAATASSAAVALQVLSTGQNRVGDLAVGSGEAVIYSHAANALAIRTGSSSTGYKYFAISAAGDMTVDGAVVATGDVTAFSDERLKTNWRDLSPTFLEDLAGLKMGIYDRKDTGETQVGVGAQGLQQFLPQAVRDANGFLTVSYGQAALASCVALAREIMAIKKHLGV